MRDGDEQGGTVPPFPPCTVGTFNIGHAIIMVSRESTGSGFFSSWASALRTGRYCRIPLSRRTPPLLFKRLLNLALREGPDRSGGEAFAVVGEEDHGACGAV